MSENSSGAPPFRPPVRDCGVRRCGPRPSFARPTDFRHAPAMSPPRAAGCIPAPATNRPRGACPIGFAGTHRLLSRLLRMSENSSGAPPFRSPVRDCGVRRCVPQRNTPAPRPSFARLTDFRHAPAMSPPRAAGHSGSGNEPPVRSLSGRLCRDASSSRPPSPDVGKFIRGAAFPIARAGLRRPLMRSAVECSRPAALFRAPDGLSARPGMSPPRAAGGIPAPATNRPHRTAPEVRPPPGAAAATVQLSGSPLPVPMRKRLACAETGVHAARAAMRPARPKHEVRTGAARRFRPNHAVRPPLADVRLFGNGSARNIERGQSAPPAIRTYVKTPAARNERKEAVERLPLQDGKSACCATRKAPGKPAKPPPAGRKGCGRCRAADRTGGGADFRTGRVCLSCCRGSARSDPSAALFVPDPRPAVSGIGPGVFRLSAAFRAPFGGPRRTKTQMHPASVPGSFPASAFASGPSARRKSEPIRIRCRFIRTFAA